MSKQSVQLELSQAGFTITHFIYSLISVVYTCELFMTNPLTGARGCRQCLYSLYSVYVKPE
jgi:hypothetical protein